MKYFLVLFLSGAALAQPLTSNFDGEIELLAQLNNPIDDLWKKALEYLRVLLKDHEPFQVPDMPEQTVTAEGISLKAKFDNVLVSKADDFVIDHLENNVLGLWAKFQVTVPKMHIDSDFTVSGTIKGKQVSSKNGHFTLDIDKLVTGGFIQVAFKGTYLQMSKFDINYTINDLQFSETGLEVEGMTKEDLDKLFHDSFLKYFQENEQFVCQQVGAYVMEQANKIMYNKSLQGLLDWLDDFIHGRIIHLDIFNFM
uniref:Juvenile hormone binding protein n=1 Tax=Riptortus pedestris TaxID=329032 RepID=R4WR16_RIPPE|nr:unknown secreted protein [Riptortus pedestris]